MAKRSLVMLADDYNPLKFKAEGSFMSEKLDGVRAIWLPFSRGLKFTEVEWANKLKDKREYVCSGLWTRRGKPIMAPDWFLNNLPDMPLDGELFSGRGNFNKTVGTVRKIEPIDLEWSDIGYKVFDVPSYEQFFRYGEIREGGKAGEPAYSVYMNLTWAVKYNLDKSIHYPQRRFTDVLNLLDKQSWNHWVHPIPFEPLDHSRVKAENRIAERLKEVTDLGGEGVMLRRGHTVWEPIRHHELVKVKKLLDSEAEIIGYVWGEGKYLGMVGAFRVRWQPPGSDKSVIFDLSGFTDSERQVRMQYTGSPGEYVELNLSESFPIGSNVTFSYNEVTRDGIPRFARYLRQHPGL